MVHIPFGRLAALIILGGAGGDQLLGIPILHKTCFFVLAFVLSILYGIRGIAIEMRTFKRDDAWKKSELWLVQYSHGFIYNFVGSLAGWIALYILSYQLFTCTGPCHPLGWSDLGLAVLALLGITGKLPETVQGFIISIGKIVESFTGKVAKS